MLASTAVPNGSACRSEDVMRTAGERWTGARYAKTFPTPHLGRSGPWLGTSMPNVGHGAVNSLHSCGRRQTILHGIRDQNKMPASAHIRTLLDERFVYVSSLTPDLPQSCGG